MPLFRSCRFWASLALLEFEISEIPSSPISATKCPLLSARVHSSPLQSHSSMSSSRIAKNPCYNRRVSEKCSFVTNTGSSEVSGSARANSCPFVELSVGRLLLSGYESKSNKIEQNRTKMPGAPVRTGIFRNSDSGKSSKSAHSPIPYPFDLAVPTTYNNQNRRTPILYLRIWGFAWCLD